MTRPGLPETIFAPSADPNWILTEKGYDPFRESSRETRFAISNGFLGVRGERAFTRGRRWTAPARTYVAGLFDQTGEAGAFPFSCPRPTGCRSRSGWPERPSWKTPPTSPRTG